MEPTGGGGLEALAKYLTEERERLIRRLGDPAVVSMEGAFATMVELKTTNHILDMIERFTEYP